MPFCTNSKLNYEFKLICKIKFDAFETPSVLIKQHILRATISDLPYQRSASLSHPIQPSFFGDGNIKHFQNSTYFALYVK